jgi:hypothetical protein
MANYIAELAETVSSQKAQGRSLQEIQASTSAASLRSLDEDYQTFLASQRDDHNVTPAEFIANGVKGISPTSSPVSISRDAYSRVQYF